MKGFGFCEGEKIHEERISIRKEDQREQNIYE